jgi:hypothetical protein
MGIMSASNSNVKLCFAVVARKQKEQLSGLGAGLTRRQHTITCWSLVWNGCCEVFAG